MCGLNVSGVFRRGATHPQERSEFLALLAPIARGGLAPTADSGGGIPLESAALWDHGASGFSPTLRMQMLSVSYERSGGYANGSFCVDRFSNRVVLFRNVSLTVPVGPLRCLAMITSAMLSGWKSGSLIR